MKKQLLFFLATFFLVGNAFAQSNLFERQILGTGGTITDTLDNGNVVTLDLSTDDVEQENNEVDSYYDDDLDAGWEGDPVDQNALTLGLRFRDLYIPQGATIDSAFIVFHAHEGKEAEDVADLDIVGEATDNATTFDENGGFTNGYLLTDRPQTNAVVNWTVAEEWVIWQPYKTVDIQPIVQELVNRSGWQSGNAMAFILLGKDQGTTTVDNAREFTSFENIADPADVDPQGNPGSGTNHPERRPYLQIYYQGNASSVSEIENVKFHMFPNPAQDGFSSVILTKNEEAIAEVINASGQQVGLFQLNEMNNRLDLSNLSQGIYIVKVTQGNQFSTQKLIIK